MEGKIKNGKFITFEGSEGCGKSTQSKLLSAYLERRGYSVVYLREPGGTAISEKIRGILLDLNNRSMSSVCEMLLYMSARAQIVEEVINPAIMQGKIVISDRFLDSTLAYQGYGLGMNINVIKDIGNIVTQGIKPDLTILLDVPLKKGLNYRNGVKDRIEQRPLVYHSRVRKGYFQLAKLEPVRIKIVKVDEDKTVTQDKIRELVDNLLKLNGAFGERVL